jgi:hypothetical protein
VDEGGDELSDEPTEFMSASDARDRLIRSIGHQFDNDLTEAAAFINKQIKRLRSELANMKSSAIDGENDVGLMERLIQSGLFPSFSFPLDVATFEVAGTKKRAGKAKAQPYLFANPGQDLKVALSEFQPGKRLTINKQSFLVEGVGVSFPENPINNVESFEFEKQRYDPLNPSELYEGASEWSYFHRCETEGCHYIIATTEADWNLDDQESCPNCKAIHGHDGNLKSTRIFTPEVFRPRIMPYNPETGKHDTRTDTWQNSNKVEMRAQEDADETAKPTRLGRPTLPTPLTKNIEEEGFVQISFESTWRNITAYRFDESVERGKELETENGDERQNSSKSAQLLLVNPGPHGNGYSVCSKCGFVNLQADAPNPHHRPYAIERTKVEHFVRREKKQEIETKQQQVNEEEDDERKAELQSELTQIRANEESDIESKMRELWWSDGSPGEAMQTCSGTFTSQENDTNLCFGMTFRTDIFLLRIEITPPLTHEADLRPFDAAFRAIKEALITEATEELELVNREISGNLRSVVVGDESTGETTRYMDMYLFDNASGGAGLVREITTENIENILERVKIRLGGQKCVDGPCSRVCIGCLLDFRNQMESDRLDRRLGYQILSYLSGETDTVDFRMVSSAGIDETVLEQEVSYLNDIYPDITISVTGSQKVEVDNGDSDGMRTLHIHSSLESPNQHPMGVVPYQHTGSVTDLSSKVISMPFEVMRDAPHRFLSACYPEDDEDDNAEIEFHPPF